MLKQSIKGVDITKLSVFELEETVPPNVSIFSPEGGLYINNRSIISLPIIIIIGNIDIEVQVSDESGIQYNEEVDELILYYLNIS